MSDTHRRKQLVMVQQMEEAGVISNKLAALYRDKDRAFHDACAEHAAVLERYTALRGSRAIDDADREFADELMSRTIHAMKDFVLVSGAIGELAYAALQASLKSSEESQ
jgi:hypothetical protein